MYCRRKYIQDVRMYKNWTMSSKDGGIDRRPAMIDATSAIDGGQDEDEIQALEQNHQW